jgi:hypothetical protein
MNQSCKSSFYSRSRRNTALNICKHMTYVNTCKPKAGRTVLNQHIHQGILSQHFPPFFSLRKLHQGTLTFNTSLPTPEKVKSKVGGSKKNSPRCYIATLIIRVPRFEWFFSRKFVGNHWYPLVIDMFEHKLRVFLCFPAMFPFQTMLKAQRPLEWFGEPQWTTENHWK